MLHGGRGGGTVHGSHAHGAQKGTLHGGGGVGKIPWDFTVCLFFVVSVVEWAGVRFRVTGNRSR